MVPGRTLIPRFAWIAAAVAVLLVLGSCGGQLSGSVGGNKKKVGFALSTLANPFFVSLRDGAQKAADSNNVQLLVADAQDDNAKQADQISNFITQKVDVIVVNPTDSDAVTPAVQKANAAKIPVIAVDRKASGGELASFIASDNVKAGRLGAEQLVKAVPAGAKLAMLVGVPGASAARDRGQGFKDGLADPSVNSKKAQLVTEQVANFKRDQGLNVMQNILTSNPDIAGVFCQNDDMALGAVQAIKAKNLTGKVFVVSVDGIPDARAAVKAGDILSDIAQQPDVMGRMAVETAAKIADKKSVSADLKVDLKVLTKASA